MQQMQKDLDSEKEPGMNEDLLGVGSVQASVDPDHFGTGRDKPFWDSVKSNIKNLHAVVSGHGEFYHRQCFSVDPSMLMNATLQPTAMNGVPGNP